MDIRDCFRKYRDEIPRLWTEAVYATYPFETKGVLRTVSDPFGNPGADMTQEAAKGLYDAVAGEETSIDDVRASLERFVKLRAVQRHTPSRALGVFFLLKPIMREKFAPHCATPAAVSDYLTAESRLDSLALMAFDMYMADRETLAQARIDEIRDRYAQIARWARSFKAGSLIAG
ncbi:MAG: RsbRD N-terminal domain-containing protein [Desulfovibrio sp.]|jgi:hypothetical protein|nr:RsbRD N-terminal domain-containing protein [Desulfovibrio sp.]